ncbi:hypothetical protein K491DRAFT_680354 [Lophiostoma macrostomum CBS 122681]|uniref:Uncharacterized protein n=1 Tax=Lophiostoma macrostomum CBS 122681 TaxID=1314788 RepID=A0A6A6T316_9PLEO|nr:hypothetical protein K491DRAFT_680354 [Lophiostoma macrostomum CBS 122681]
MPNRARSVTISNSQDVCRTASPQIHRSASFSHLKSTLEPEEKRVTPGYGSLESTFFNKLHYDARCVVYSHMLPILNEEAAWKGFALSCRQAYAELSEFAPIEVKKFIDRCLRDSESELGYQPKLFNEIDLSGGFAALRRITVEIEANFVNLRQGIAAPIFNFADTEVHMRHPGYKFFDGALARVLHPLVSKHFSKVTFLMRTNDSKDRPFSSFVKEMEDKKMEAMRACVVWKKMVDAGELFQMLCHIQVNNDKEYEAGSPGSFLWPRYKGAINTSCFAVTYDPGYDKAGYDLGITHPSIPWYGSAKVFASEALYEEWARRLASTTDNYYLKDPLPRFYYLGLPHNAHEIGFQSDLGWDFIKDNGLAQMWGASEKAYFGTGPRCRNRGTICAGIGERTIFLPVDAQILLDLSRAEERKRHSEDINGIFDRLPYLMKDYIFKRYAFTSLWL